MPSGEQSENVAHKHTPPLPTGPVCHVNPEQLGRISQVAAAGPAGLDVRAQSYRTLVGG